MDAAQLQSELQNFTGTEQWYRSPLYHMLWSDGVKHFAEKAGAYWFIDICGTELAKLQAKWPFMVVTLKVAHNCATIEVSDGDENIVHMRHIEFTDCPAGDWKFYLTNNVLHLPTEY